MARKKKPHLLASHHVPRKFDAEAIPDLMTDWEAPRGAERIEAIDVQMADILERAGLPLKPGKVFMTDESGNFHEYASGTLYRRVRVSGLHNLAEAKGHVIGSEVWYAARLREKIADWRQASSAADETYVIESLLSLGWLLNEAKMITTHGRPLENGLRTFPRFQESRDRRNKEKRLEKEAWEKKAVPEAMKIIRESPKLSSKNVARRVIKRLGLKDSQLAQVRKAIGKARKG